VTTSTWAYSERFGWAQVLPGGVDLEDASIVLHNVHSIQSCLGRPCVIHNPSDHHMRSWMLIWRNDRPIFERICPHGIGHPDPDQFDYWQTSKQWFMGTHGCDFCCYAPRNDLTS
jgi:hypothetical protein